jgi:hypothetical protein
VTFGTSSARFVTLDPGHHPIEGIRLVIRQGASRLHHAVRGLAETQSEQGAEKDCQ